MRPDATGITQSVCIVLSMSGAALGAILATGAPWLARGPDDRARSRVGPPVGGPAGRDAARAPMEPDAAGAAVGGAQASPDAPASAAPAAPKFNDGQLVSWKGGDGKEQEGYVVSATEDTLLVQPSGPMSPIPTEHGLS